MSNSVRVPKENDRCQHSRQPIRNLLEVGTHSRSRLRACVGNRERWTLDVMTPRDLSSHVHEARLDYYFSQCVFLHAGCTTNRACFSFVRSRGREGVICVQSSKVYTINVVYVVGRSYGSIILPRGCCCCCLHIMNHPGLSTQYSLCPY